MKRVLALFLLLFAVSVSAQPTQTMDAVFVEIQTKLDEISNLSGTGKEAKARKAQRALQARVNRLFAPGTTIELSTGCPVSISGGLGVLSGNGELQCAYGVRLWWNTIPDETRETIEDMDATDIAGSFVVIRNVGPVDLSVTETGQLLIPVKIVRPIKGD